MAGVGDTWPAVEDGPDGDGEAVGATDPPGLEVTFGVELADGAGVGVEVGVGVGVGAPASTVTTTVDDPVGPLQSCCA